MKTTLRISTNGEWFEKGDESDRTIRAVLTGPTLDSYDKIEAMARSVRAAVERAKAGVEELRGDDRLDAEYMRDAGKELLDDEAGTINTLCDDMVKLYHAAIALNERDGLPQRPETSDVAGQEATIARQRAGLLLASENKRSNEALMYFMNRAQRGIEQRDQDGPLLAWLICSTPFLEEVAEARGIDPSWLEPTVTEMLDQADLTGKVKQARQMLKVLREDVANRVADYGWTANWHLKQLGHRP